MNVLCLIFVAMTTCNNTPCSDVLVSTTARGEIIIAKAGKYLVNFSEYTKTKTWVGDYSSVLVDIDKCVRLK